MQRTRSAGVTATQHTSGLRQTCECLLAVEVRVGVQHLLPEQRTRARLCGRILLLLVVFLHLGVQGSENLSDQMLQFGIARRTISQGAIT